MQSTPERTKEIPLESERQACFENTSMGSSNKKRHSFGIQKNNKDRDSNTSLLSIEKQRSGGAITASVVYPSMNKKTPFHHI
jgi:hypothetical protein